MLDLYVLGSLYSCLDELRLFLMMLVDMYPDNVLSLSYLTRGARVCPILGSTVLSPVLRVEGPAAKNVSEVSLYCYCAGRKTYFWFMELLLNDV